MINTSLSLFSEENSFNINDFKSHLNFFVSKYPVEPHSADEESVFDYIRNTLYEERIPYTSPLLYDTDDNPEGITVLDIQIPGESEAEIIFVVPVNGIKNATRYNGGGVNCALGLSLASYYKGRSFPYSVRILFLGSESAGENLSDAGSYHYMENIYYTRDSVVIYLGLSDLSGDLRIIPGANYRITPSWMMRELDRSLAEKGLGYKTELFDQVILKTGLSGRLSPLSPYMDNELPAVHLTNDYDPIKTSLSKKIDPEILILALTGFLEEGDGTFPSENDTNYMFFKWRGKINIIPEIVFIFSFIILILVLFIFIFVNKKVFVHHIRRTILPRFLWFPLSYSLTFIYLFLSCLVLDLILIIRDDPMLWTEIPLYFLLLKILLTFLFSHLFLYVTGGLNIARSPHFYTYHAILSTLLNIFIFSAFNIRLGNLFFWTLLLVLIFASFKKYIPKLILSLIMPAVIIGLSIYLIIKPYPEFTRFILLSGIPGSLMLTLILQPYIAVFMAVIFMPRHYRKRVPVQVELVQPVILFFVVALLFSFLAFFPLSILP